MMSLPFVFFGLVSVGPENVDVVFVCFLLVALLTSTFHLHSSVRTGIISK